MTSFRQFFLVVGLLALTAVGASAQVPIGTPPFGSFGGGPDVIDLANLNSHIAIPVLHKAGRGTNFTYDLSYDSSVWYPVTANSTTSWQPVYNLGWRAQTEVVTGYISGTSTYVRTGVRCYSRYYSFVYHDPWGIPHPFPGQESYNGGPAYDCDPPSWNELNSTAGDGSGYSIATYHSGATVYSRDGKVINPPGGGGTGPGNFTDRNGNQITVNGSGQFFDTLSGTTAALTVAAPPLPASTTFTYTAPSGAAAYTMKYGTYTVQTSFGCSGVSDFGPTVEYLVSEIDLPDNSKYTFTYEPTYQGSGNVTGRLASVTLPTGGTITYTYTGGSSGHITCSDGSASGLQRQVYDGTNTNTWTYTRVMGTGAQSETTVTAPKLSYDPVPNQSILQFQGIYQTQSNVYQGSAPAVTSLPISEAALQTSGLLREVQTCYNLSATPCPGTAITMPISGLAVTTILAGSANLHSKVVSSFNSYGQLSEEDDYPYGSGAPGSTAIRKKIITIQTVGTYQAIQTAQIQDGLGNILSQTTMTFDQGSVTATSGTPQHTNPTVGRGNPTTISYLVQGSTSLTKTLTFYDTGNVRSITDVNGAATTYNYPDSTSTCGNSFPTTVTEPIAGFLPSIAWNCIGGVEMSSTDENSKTASTSYTDTQFWRPHSATDQLSNVTTLTYGGPTSVESSMPFNGSISTSDKLVTLDRLGRSRISQTRQSPTSTSYDSVETDYDVVGRPYRVTMPYSAVAGQTCSGACPATTTTYDALGRPVTVTDAGGGTASFNYPQNDVYQTLGPAPTNESTKRRQSEYDSLGRLTSVCEITAGTSQAPAGTCSQNSAATGYWTKYTYDANGNLKGVTQNAQASSGQQQTRSYSYDGLSRMTSETNPETGMAAVNYTYDFDSTCGTSGGDLVKKTDPVGNTICHAYDALHRVTSTTYAGTYASVTPNKYFVYDTATVNGVAMAITKTRLAEAYTCFSPCSSKITDLGFSYTARGEVSDQYESTPHSGGYYHVAATYWPNGVLNQLTNSPSGYYIAYGVDGEGRAYSTTDGGGSHPLASTLYNSASLPTQVNLGYSGDSDSYSYDPNTNRMAQYKFNVNGQSVTGNLNWNAVGTLSSLGISDPFDSSNNQTCSYSHDDLVRIASANCGSIWSQTFSFDAFGNINKAGNSSFGATYSPATNRMTTIGTSTPSYDANGNVTNDFLHTYSWDANGRPVAIDGVGITYDALGRMLEQNHSGAYTRMVYSPTGFLMETMNGPAFRYAFSPLPAGGATVWSPAGIYYRHADWLGSSRFASTISRTMYYDGAYAPFGEQYANSGTADLSFTGMDQGTSSNLYDFPAREYGIQGRWPSPDPAGIGAVNLSDPQSWNRYTYVLNNPLAMVDPTGLCPDPTAYSITVCADPVGIGITYTYPDGSDAGGGTFGGGGSGPGIGKDDPRSLLFCLRNAHSMGVKDIRAYCRVGGAPPPKPQSATRDEHNNPCTASVFNPSCQVPSCPAVFFDSALHATDLPASPAGSGPEDAATAVAGAFAARHIIQRGLVVALRSSIVRKLLLGGAIASDILAYGPVLYSAGVGLRDEGNAWMSGTCRTIWSH